MAEVEAAPIAHDRNVVADWDQAHRYTPAPRHRRRLIVSWLRPLQPAEVLDAGCGQPFLLEEVTRKLGISGAGTDISDEVMEQAARSVPNCDFLAFDLSRQRWPGGRRFDTVVCSETLEHIPDWGAALENLVAMTERWLLITVPTGKVRPVDRLMGHTQHFYPEDLIGPLERLGCEVVRVRSWGFPVHSLYRVLVSRMADRIYDSFASGKEYSRGQRIFSELLNVAFYANDLFRGGGQLMILARRRDAAA
jgi:SAM-dependent methyltransferase